VPFDSDTDTGTQTESGNSILGTFSRTTTDSDVSARTEVLTNGPLTVSAQETDNSVLSRSESGNAITGSYSATQTNTTTAQSSEQDTNQSLTVSRSETDTSQASRSEAGGLVQIRVTLLLVWDRSVVCLKASAASLNWGCPINPVSGGSRRVRSS
jgi:hypothetical protein